MQSKKPYDLAFLVYSLLGMIAMCAIMKVTGGTGFLLIFLATSVAFGRNRIEILLYLILMTATLTVTNAYFAPKGMAFSIGARVLFLLVGSVMMLQLTAQRSSRMMTPVLTLLVYIGYMAIISSVGWNPLISYLKIILFVIIFLAMFSVGNAAVVSQRIRVERLRSVFLCMAAFMILGSILVLPFPGISMMNAADFIGVEGFHIPDSGLFKGMSIHSQCLGPSIAMLAVVLLADLLFSVRRWDKVYLLLLLCTPIVVFRTGSRTAMGTLLAGVFFVSFLFVNARGMGARWKTRATSALMILGIIGGCLLFITPQMREKVVSFIYKSGRNTVAEEYQTVENLVSSRQGLMDNAMANFRESPWIGNGFQVSKEFAYREIVSWKQVLSAPIEKGVWVTAVLEEGGVFGMTLFAIFLLVAIFGLLARRAVTGAAALFVFIIANFGEFTFFSMSYTGGLMWAMVFTGVALDAQRLKEDRLRRQMAFQGPVTVSAQGYRF